MGRDLNPGLLHRTLCGVLSDPTSRVATVTMPTNEDCFCCKISTEPNKLITCCVCQNKFKYSCAGLSLSEVKTLSKTGISWTCPNCNEFGQNINELKAILLDLKNEVAALKAENNKLVGKSSLDDIAFEEVVHEVAERQRRKKNIIIYGLKESTDKNTYKEDDKLATIEILNHLLADQDFSFINPIRLGKYVSDTNKKRPIKVTLQDEHMPHNILHLAMKLREVDHFKMINISLDRTPRQIRLHTSCKKELETRLSQGESNLKIKYINGIPKIISSN